MDSPFKADIFFVVTTGAVVIVTIGIVWLLVYLVRIFRNIRDISETAKKETALLARDVDGIRSTIGRRRIWLLAGLMKTIFGFVKGRNRRKRS